MKTKVIRYYADPGHAWAKVKISELIKLNIAHEISIYSYERGDWAYLEEDSDLIKYVDALKARGIEPIFKGSSGNKRSKIRGYNCYDNTTKGVKHENL
jgi:hypothetical protein